MTEEEVFRLKPGDLLRIETPTPPDRAHRPRVHYAVVVDGAGPDISLSWQQFSRSLPLSQWVFVSAETISSVLHRSRLTRIA